MTKRDFEKFIKDNMKDLPLEKQEELFRKIHYEWIDDLHDKFNKKLKEKYTKCSYCHRYSLKDQCKIAYIEKTESGVCVFTDCGYGDDDEYADVTYMVEYYICPLCGELTEKRRTKLREHNRHKPRW